MSLMPTPPTTTRSHRLFFALNDRGERVEFVAVRSEIGEQCAVTLNGHVEYVAAPTARGVDSALDRFRQLSRATGPRPARNATAPRKPRGAVASDPDDDCDGDDHATLSPDLLAAAHATPDWCHSPAAA